MFGKSLSIAVIGQGCLAKQTSSLANRWAKISILEIDSLPYDFDCYSWDLVLICIDNTSDIEKDTADIIDLVEKWDSEVVSNVFIRTIVTPGTASRLGVHLWNSMYSPKDSVKDQQMWLFGFNTAAATPYRLSQLEDCLAHLLDSAFQSGILTVKPKLDIVSLQEAESTLFAQQALNALTAQFNKELTSYLEGLHLNHDKIISHLDTHSRKSAYLSPIANSGLECWLGSMSEHSNTFPLLTRLNNLLMK